MKKLANDTQKKTQTPTNQKNNGDSNSVIFVRQPGKTVIFRKQDEGGLLSNFLDCNVNNRPVAGRFDDLLVETAFNASLPASKQILKEIREQMKEERACQRQ